MHGIYYGTRIPPHRQPIPLVAPGDRIGDCYLHCDPAKVIAVVETSEHDRNSPFSPPDETSERIAGHIIQFLQQEVSAGRLPVDLLPLQSGVGNIANAVLIGLNKGPFNNSHRIHRSAARRHAGDDQVRQADHGLGHGSVVQPGGAGRVQRQHRLFPRAHRAPPPRMSNHPEVIRRLGLIAMNAMIEADIYGNVNSTHIMGSSIMNGIGGSGDFARNAYLSFFMTPSTAKDGAISCIVPMVSHTDHTEHDVEIIVTEQGLADLRGKSPTQRAQLVIEHCAHPDFRPALRDYFDRALQTAPGRHTPHILSEALSWHDRFVKIGRML